jgi:hypothetical protein
LQERQGYAKSRVMPTDRKQPDAPATDANQTGQAGKPPLSPAAERALAEAAARRAQQTGQSADAAKEISGRGGLDPTRYGDWEINGLTSDF